MPAYSSTRRGMSPALVIFLGLTVLAVCGAGTVAGLWAIGVIDLPFLRPREPSREGWVLVPLSGRTVAPYALIHRDDLANPQTGLWNDQWIPKGALPPNVVTDRAKIIGRVMNHEKGPGYVFTEADFMPPGTRFGVVAGIPPGKRSFTIEAAKISGIHGLQLGDRFDLVGTLPVDKNHPMQQQRNVRGIDGLPAPEPEVRVLVSNGMIVSPLRIRAAVSTSNSLMSGSRTTSKPVEEVVIALSPEEIPGLTAAMTRDATIALVARSGHPDDAKIDSVTPESNPPPPPTVIETVVGGKRETLVFPQLMSDEKPLSGPQRSMPFPLRPHGQPRPLRVATSNDAADEAPYAPHKPGVRVSP